MQNQKCVSWKYLISRMWHKVFINRMWNIILNISKDPWFQNLHLVCLNLWLQISEVSPNHLLTTQCPVTRSPARCWQSTSLVAAVTYANVMEKVHTVKRRFTMETLPRCLLSCSSVRPEHLTNMIAFNPRNNTHAAMTPVRRTWDEQAECPSHSLRYAGGSARCVT